MRINNNIMALNAHRQLGVNQTGASKSMERLSSGLRINRAGDDAAGLAISEKMRGQIRGLKQAGRNAQDGISLIQTAEGALNETHSILQRMRELAAQAANDTNTEIDRGEIQKEINELTSEINRIGNTTEFNTMKLLDGSRSATSGTGDVVTRVVGGEIDVFTALGVTAADGAIELEGNILTFTDYDGFNWASLDHEVEDQTISISKTDEGLSIEISAVDEDGNELAVNDTITPNFVDGEYTYSAHGISFTITEEAFKAATVDEALEFNLFDAAGEPTATFSMLDNGGVLSTRNDWEENVGLAVFDGGITVDADAINAAFGDGVADNIVVEFDSADTTFTVTIWDADDNELSIDNYVIESFADGESFEYNNHGISFKINVADASKDFETNAISFVTAETEITEDKSLAFQIGANEAQALNLSISDMRSVALGVSSAAGGDGFVSSLSVTNGTDAALAEYSLDVSSHESAAQALTTIDAAIGKVSAERSMLGATQNRLEHTISNLGTSAENLQAAEARIRDLDMAEEIMAFTKNNILQQAATAMLAQANMAPQSVLQLLG